MASRVRSLTSSDSYRIHPVRLCCAEQHGPARLFHSYAPAQAFERGLSFQSRVPASVGNHNVLKIVRALPVLGSGLAPSAYEAITYHARPREYYLFVFIPLAISGGRLIYYEYLLSQVCYLHGWNTSSCPTLSAIPCSCLAWRY